MASELPKTIRERVEALRLEAIKAAENRLDRIAANPQSCWCEKDLGITTSFYLDAWIWHVIAYDSDGGVVGQGSVRIPDDVWDEVRS